MTTTFTNGSKSSSSFANSAKASSSFSNGTKSTTSFANGTKHDSDFTYYLRHGHEPLIGDTGDHQDIGDKTFDDVAFLDGTLVADTTFDTLTDQAWSNASKN